MEDPTTIALNLTFFGTLGVAFVLFVGLFIVFVATLVLAGVGRLVAVTVMAVAGILGKSAGMQQARSANPAKPARSGRTAKKEPTLSPEWVAAVARADARADERAAAKAKAEAAPAVKVPVRDLPSSKAPAQDVKEVAPLVESATDQNGDPNAAPRAFKKPPVPAAKARLETGPLVSLQGRHPLAKYKRQGQERKAG